ncbi:GHKL domain-containing protein [Halomicroarcula limicola]|uniref:histidine kinase n=1 Tax=Haloarcula limicola TaxID=1429915 RepID=A0A8J7YCZ7_9EURY|nr:ATP-binding protein [Halomicroarcula limicola]MBV0924966.1 GHKL domain-containing protein [Halomicroarcula limicola]
MYRGRGDATIPSAIYAGGILLLSWSIVEPVALLLTGSPDVFRHRYLIGYVTIVPACLTLIWGGRWLPRSDIPAKYDATIAMFSVAAGAGFLLFNLFLMLFFPTGSTWIVTNWVRWALSLGLCVGFVIGTLYSRGLSGGIAAERQSLRAEHMRKKRELIHHMNSILRHEVLNSAQVIQGNAESLRQSDDAIDPSDERISRIYRQGTDLTEVTREVRALLNVVEGDRQLQPVNLTETLRDEVERIRLNHPDVDIDLSVPAGIVVEGDDLLGRVFGNLLRNAVEHNAPGSLRIAVEVETVDEAAAVAIRDNGDGIPERCLDTLFDRPQVGTHGLGLHIVRELVNSYSGTVELVDTGTGGTTFEVTVPLARARAAGPAEAKNPVDRAETPEI